MSPVAAAYSFRTGSVTLAAAALVAASATGCEVGAANARVYTKQDVVAAFSRADLPVREVVEGEVSCDELFDTAPRSPDPVGVDTLGETCAVVVIETGDRRLPNAVLLRPRDRTFTVSVFSSSEGAEDMVSATPPKDPVFDSEWTLIRERNVVVTVWPADDEVTEQVEKVLDDL